jgi:hypothetical protein
MALLNKSWLRVRVENALKKGFTQAYETVRVDPQRYLLHLRVAHDLPITTFRGIYSVPLAQIDDIAAQTVRAGMKMAMAEGAGLGIGGMLTVVPDLGFLAVITLRTIQKLSLLYGFEYNTDEEMAELWIAAASAAGVDISRELMEKQVVSKFVPRVIQAMAAQASKEAVEKWAGRVIPVLSSVIGAGLNYLFVRAWSERAIKHFRDRHIAIRDKMAGGEIPFVGAPHELTSGG